MLAFSESWKYLHQTNQTMELESGMRRGSKSGLLLMVEDDTVKKALVGLAIEKALLDLGKPVLDQVTKSLESEHGCYIFDCYNNPKVLYSVLRGLYGESHKTIVEAIKKNLDEFVYQEPINRFVSAISE